MKTILVIGATGAQGGGLVRALQARGQFAVRALTRNPDGEKGKALTASGVEVVAGDLNDVASLMSAMDGVYGVFAVTNFWEVVSTEIEKQQAQNIATACREMHIQHIVWSTLEDTRTYIPEDYSAMPMMHDIYRVPHLDCKNEANAYFKDLPTTYLITSYFWDNLINFGMAPKPNEDGVYQFVMPMADKPLAAHASEDIGKAVAPMFEQPARFIGETVGIQTEALTCDEMCQIMAEEFGLNVQYVPVDADTYRAFPFPGADEIGNNFQYFCDFNADFMALRSAELMAELNPDAMDFRTYVQRNKAALRAVMDSFES